MIIIGHKYGKLTPIKKMEKVNKSCYYYLFRCECGNVKKIRSSNIITGHTKSCGCIRKMENVYDVSGGLCIGYDEQGNKFTADIEDYEKLNLYYWRFEKSTGYFQSNINGKSIYMHRFILGLNHGSKMCVDHINRDKSDNRKLNLRLCSKQQNGINKISPNQAIGKYRGVTKVKRKYSASITFNYKRYHLGYFDTPEKAAIAYNKKAKELFGDFAVLNEFPF